MTGLWLWFTVAYIAFFYVFRDAKEIADASLDGYLEVILLGVPTVILLGGRMWLRDSHVDADLRPRLVGWTVGMALFFALAVYTTLFIIEPRFDTGEQWLLLLMSTGFGASAGTVMGALEIRSKQRERERNQSLRAVRRTERERSQLENLNHYLRHEVLNEAQKINGFATILADRSDIDEETADHLDTVRHSSAEIAAFIQSIRTILDASNHNPDLTVVDLMALVEREVEMVRKSNPAVSVVVEGPDTAPVLADDVLNRVFRNLLENAIEHNGGDLTLALTVERGDDWVTARLRDDGSGIPEHEQEGLFDPPDSGDHGYGLFLTHNLVQMYEGRLELGSTGPEGTEFVVEFPAAPTDEQSTANASGVRAAS